METFFSPKTDFSGGFGCLATHGATFFSKKIFEKLRSGFRFRGGYRTIEIYIWQQTTSPPPLRTFLTYVPLHAIVFLFETDQFIKSFVPRPDPGDGERSNLTIFVCGARVNELKRIR